MQTNSNTGPQRFNRGMFEGEKKTEKWRSQKRLDAEEERKKWGQRGSLLTAQDLGWPWERALREEVPASYMQNSLAQAKVKTGLVSSPCLELLLFGQNSLSFKLKVSHQYLASTPGYSLRLFKISQQIYIVGQPDLSFKYCITLLFADFNFTPSPISPLSPQIT